MAGTNENVDQGETGLVAGHAYSILSAHEVNHQGRNWRLLKMVNPWGFGEWKGEWSDDSPLWTPQLKEMLGAKDEDDGEFFMPLEAYYQCYQATSITAEMDKKYQHTQYTYDFTTCPKGEFFTFEIDRPLDLVKEPFSISVAQ